MKVLRLVLGDQLNLKHSWFAETDAHVTYLMAELVQESTYTVHHIQKICGFFLSMRDFANKLALIGHRVDYVKITDGEAKLSFAELISKRLTDKNFDVFEYQEPDEYRLDIELNSLSKKFEVKACSSEHFLTERNQLLLHFGRKPLLMEKFYRQLRQEKGYLMKNGLPEGGKWNFDSENRNQWKGKPAIPSHQHFENDASEVLKEIQSAGLSFIGKEKNSFDFPINRDQALRLLHHFREHFLPFFGTFQDAMHSGEPFLFHSRLSFALNLKMIHPDEVCQAVEQAYRKGHVYISHAEGFIRQVVGWREYIRGVYWREMPAYTKSNFFEHTQPLPKFFWTGNTRMRCVQYAVQNSLDHAYAHHIQRLMITGNFALLAETKPEEVDAWYLGIYADAVEWVQLPNTHGMSQFADGGLMSTKPYISSANYINKMSNYCTGCTYAKNLRTSDKACPFNSLYWHFLDEKRDKLQKNIRMKMMYALLNKIPSHEIAEIKARALKIIENPDAY